MSLLISHEKSSSQEESASLLLAGHEHLLLLARIAELGHAAATNIAFTHVVVVVFATATGVEASSAHADIAKVAFVRSGWYLTPIYVLQGGILRQERGGQCKPAGACVGVYPDHHRLRHRL